MSTFSYHTRALAQYFLYQYNLRDMAKVLSEIAQLKARIANKHKKYRRCDRDIIKQIKCYACDKTYASYVALKLHQKLKHREEKTVSSLTEEDHHLTCDEKENRLGSTN